MSQILLQDSQWETSPRKRSPGLGPGQQDGQTPLPLPFSDCETWAACSLELISSLGKWEGQALWSPRWPLPRMQDSQNQQCLVTDIKEEGKYQRPHFILQFCASRASQHHWEKAKPFQFAFITFLPLPHLPHADHPCTDPRTLQTHVLMSSRGRLSSPSPQTQYESPEVRPWPPLICPRDLPRTVVTISAMILYVTMDYLFLPFPQPPGLASAPYILLEHPPECLLPGSVLGRLMYGQYVGKVMTRLLKWQEHDTKEEGKNMCQEPNRTIKGSYFNLSNTKRFPIFPLNEEWS